MMQDALLERVGEVVLQPELLFKDWAPQCEVYALGGTGEELWQAFKARQPLLEAEGRHSAVEQLPVLEAYLAPMKTLDMTCWMAVHESGEVWSVFYAHGASEMWPWHLP